VLRVQLLDYLFEQPVVTVRMVEKRLGCTFATANKFVDQFEQLAILKKVAHGVMRNRRFRYDPYLALFEEGIPLSKKEEAAVQTTGGKEEEEFLTTDFGS
jgi:DeoR/GlpR family transcriptional regulator of sugar metabolism